jgi:hypothetical protein
VASRSAAGGPGHPGAKAAQRSSPGAIPPSPSVTGDYDPDDERFHNRKHGSDADNDDAKPTDRDNDSDNRTHSYFDADDRSMRDFGRAASTRDRRAIERLVWRYFAVADAEDGATACTMIVSTLARAIPEDLGRGAGPLYARGATCGAVVSKIFVHYHRQIAAHVPTLAVSDVRVSGDRGVAVMAFKGLPGRLMHVVRERGTWMVGGVLDLELP